MLAEVITEVITHRGIAIVTLPFSTLQLRKVLLPALDPKAPVVAREAISALCPGIHDSWVVRAPGRGFWVILSHHFRRHDRRAGGDQEACGVMWDEDGSTGRA